MKLKTIDRTMLNKVIILVTCTLLLFNVGNVQAQMQWTADGNGYYSFSDKGVDIVSLTDSDQNTSFLSSEELIPSGAHAPLDVQSFQVSPQGNQLLLFANTTRVWRENTKGDYWIYNKETKTLEQLGAKQPESSLMFAKFSPDGTKVAYVAKHNIFIENLADHTVQQVTNDGGNGIINGTFDWVYEEEFGTQDGFRWSPDSKKIAFWKLDARATRNFLMINNTDSIYSYTIPVEYPKVGMSPSGVSIWIYDIDDKNETKVEIQGAENQIYIPRMEWLNNSSAVILQQLNRKQNESQIIVSQAVTGQSKLIHKETSDTWIDIKARWNNNDPSGWDWIDQDQTFLWVSEKNGWRQIYSIDMNGREKLITKDDFDIINIDLIDRKHKIIYFTASPQNATQTYLYRININGGKAKRVTPKEFPGTNNYTISPNGKLALFSSGNTERYIAGSVISLPEHTQLQEPVREINAKPEDPKVEFFKVTTIDGVTLDGWMVKPINFDPSKKYPVVFYVYGEPASQTVTDNYGTGKNRLYTGDMATDGYIYVSLENRGAPAPKGAAWRKSIYRKIGRLNIRDQAMGAKEVFKFGFVDTTRVAVWGWSGGGASTLNLLGQYPEIYQTGISIAPVTNQLLYDNIYQERYMGLPQENKEDFVNGSALTYAKNVKGNLLLIHGTGDDNVHYQNAEVYINALIEHNIPFQMMSYPNRSHSISEGKGTSAHLATIYTRFLKANCPPGGR